MSHDRTIEEVIGWTRRDSGMWDAPNGDLRGHATVYDLLDLLAIRGRKSSAFAALEALVREVER